SCRRNGSTRSPPKAARANTRSSRPTARTDTCSLPTRPKSGSRASWKSSRRTAIRTSLQGERHREVGARLVLHAGAGTPRPVRARVRDVARRKPRHEHGADVLLLECREVVRLPAVVHAEREVVGDENRRRDFGLELARVALVAAESQQAHLVRAR